MSASGQTSPRVSVLMITYTHERYIAQAIESVLMQRTSFRIELVIGEDCSTDGTREIVRRYAAQRPDIVRALLHPKNIGMGPNADATSDACRGELIATLEGDDFWTDPHKLQRQVDWLNAHPKSPACFHNATIIEEDGTMSARHYCEPPPPPLVSLEELLKRNPVPTCSVVYRRNLVLPLPEAVRPLPMHDWPSWVLAARSGPLGYIDETWASYRRHGGGQFSAIGNEKQVRNVLRFYAAMHGVLGPKYRVALGAADTNFLSTLVDLLLHQGRGQDARPPALRYLRLPPRRFVPPAGRFGVYYRLALGRPSAVMRRARTAPLS